ncbi:hypothetical protein COT75_02405 [Candidatus Beckwithbacteria bacterium CG10_big_fil_rev_8_21_14_0_10_34_10]|uniref:Uncharacterized protein n=1 Tax=Candidatus Beckwithbacteria bacterium CG10_big_fil_rev_8_21_14_0_10_34_10 TaxID=1974495 RepID=A0A2H0W9B3_9BACT|nr:MAG: hypothetical protein COT75_02405 [Candidatus Beckwithbacteria bacterium CG10_big_fil_rev_8_21_14_0_10_34_10]
MVEISSYDQINQDVPDSRENVELTSSIGGLWPPQIASFDRLKGIYIPSIIEKEGKLGEFIGQLRRSSLRPEFGNVFSRLSWRMIIDQGLLKDSVSQLGDYLEAVIPLSETQACFSASALVYVGINHHKRQPLAEEVAGYKENLREICGSQERRLIETVMNRCEDKGYQIGVIDLPKEGKEREEIIDKIHVLYTRFGWRREEVEAILNNPNNIIGIARFGQEIVSAGIAEMAQVPVGENTLRIIELTEAATRLDHARNGLYTAVSAGLLIEIADRSLRGQILDGEVDIVFGECNGNALGVLKTAKIQGRTFCWEIGALFNYPQSGMLPQHVPISGAERQTKYNDLFPAFLTKEKLINIYGGKK